MKKKGLLVSEKHGVNPSMEICDWCGKDTGAILLLGKLKDDAEAPPRVRTGHLCDSCQAKKKEHDEIVREGGVYWKCVDCGSCGVLRKEAELTKAVREHSGILPPNPVGVSFSKERPGWCPVCYPEGDCLNGMV